MVFVAGANEHQIAGIEPFGRTVDVVDASSAFDPENFWKVMRVKRRGPVPSKAKASEMIPFARRHELPPTLQFGHINIP
jgi:hypothetical protein